MPTKLQLVLLQSHVIHFSGIFVYLKYLKFKHFLQPYNTKKNLLS